MTRPTANLPGLNRPGRNGPAGHLLRDAAAPLLLLAALATGGLATLDVWCAAGLATGTWPPLSPALVVALLRDGPAVVLPPGSPVGGFTVLLAALAGTEAACRRGRRRGGDPGWAGR